MHTEFSFGPIYEEEDVEQAIGAIFEEGLRQNVVVSALGWDRYDVYFRKKQNIFCLVFKRDTWDFYEVPGDFRLEDARVYLMEEVDDWLADYDRKVEESEKAWKYFLKDIENRPEPNRYRWEDVRSLCGEIPSLQLDEVLMKHRNVQLQYEEELQQIALDAITYQAWLDDPEADKEGPAFLNNPIFQPEDVGEKSVDSLYNEELFDEIIASAVSFDKLFV